MPSANDDLATMDVSHVVEKKKKKSKTKDKKEEEEKRVKEKSERKEKKEKKEKKHKKDKKDKSEKKDKKEKKKSKHKERDGKVKREHADSDSDDTGDVDGHISKKLKSLAVDETNTDTQTPSPAQPSKTPLQPADCPHTMPPYPLYKRNVSEWVPVYPIGFGRALDYLREAHLGRLLNNYVPKLSGVLVSYKNPTLSQNQEGDPPDMPLELLTLPDTSPAFCWLHYEAGLFVPRQGAWMEGVVNLEDPEHIGIVCWKLFNAFISTKRLPSSWSWIEDPEEHDVDQDTEHGGNEDFMNAMDVDEPGRSQRGHWIDEDGRPIHKRIIRFRITHFDAHASAYSSHLSIEGTMLTEEDEKVVAREEAAMRRLGGRRLQKWGVTKMGRQDDQDRQ